MGGEGLDLSALNWAQRGTQSAKVQSGDPEYLRSLDKTTVFPGSDDLVL